MSVVDGRWSVIGKVQHSLLTFFTEGYRFSSAYIASCQLRSGKWTWQVVWTVRGFTRGAAQVCLELAQTCIAHDGEIRHEPTREALQEAG